MRMMLSEMVLGAISGAVTCAWFLRNHLLPTSSLAMLTNYNPLLLSETLLKSGYSRKCDYMDCTKYCSHGSPNMVQKEPTDKPRPDRTQQQCYVSCAAAPCAHPPVGQSMGTRCVRAQQSMDAPKASPEPPECGWLSPYEEMKQVDPDVRQQQLLLLANEDITLLSSPGAYKITNRLQEAYARGTAIAMPGARQTLDRALAMVDSLSDTTGISQGELAQLNLLRLWIEQAKQCGSLHNTTEQICFCLSLVRIYFARHYQVGQLGKGEKTLLREIPQRVTLGDILAMPWRLYQSQNATFFNVYRELGFQLHPEIAKKDGNKKVIASQWPRLCTFEHLNIDYFNSLMGQRVLVVGFLTSAWEIHDRRYFTANSMPFHDLIHAEKLLDLWKRLTRFLDGKSGCSDDSLAAPDQKAYEVMEQLAIATEHLYSHLCHLNPLNRKLCHLLLFEFYHETFGGNAEFFRWTRSFEVKDWWKAEQSIQTILDALDQRRINKYITGSVMAEDRKPTREECDAESRLIQEAFASARDQMKQHNILPAGVRVAQVFLEEVRNSFLQKRSFDPLCFQPKDQTTAGMAARE